MDALSTGSPGPQGHSVLIGPSAQCLSRTRRAIVDDDGTGNLQLPQDADDTRARKGDVDSMFKHSRVKSFTVFSTLKRLPPLRASSVRSIDQRWLVRHGIQTGPLIAEVVGKGEIDLYFVEGIRPAQPVNGASKVPNEVFLEMRQQLQAHDEAVSGFPAPPRR